LSRFSRFHLLVRRLPTLLIWTRSYRGHVYKHALRHLEPQSPSFSLLFSPRVFLFFRLSSLHPDSGATKRKTEPTNRRAYFSPRQVLPALSLSRPNLCPLKLTCAFHPRYNSIRDRQGIETTAHINVDKPARTFVLASGSSLASAPSLSSSSMSMGGYGRNLHYHSVTVVYPCGRGVSSRSTGLESLRVSASTKAVQDWACASFCRLRRINQTTVRGVEDSKCLRVEFLGLA